MPTQQPYSKAKSPGCNTAARYGFDYWPQGKHHLHFTADTTGSRTPDFMHLVLFTAEQIEKGIPNPQEMITLYDDAIDTWTDTFNTTFTALDEDMYIGIIANRPGETQQHLYLDNYALREGWVTTMNCDPNNPNNALAEGRGYRFGFNGKERDDEIKGAGNSLDFGARIYDSRLGRFLSIDRFASKVPGESPYGFASNMPIVAIDINGDSTYLIIAGAGYDNYRLKGRGHDQGNGFLVNAQALKKKIESSATFDPNRDEVVIVYAPNTKRFIDAVNKVYSSGKIASLTVFSHGYSYSATNGTGTGGISLGGEFPGERRLDGTIVTQAEADDQLNDYQKREINGLTVGQIDKSNFEPNARVVLYGCFLGGGSQWTDQEIEDHSWGQRLANYLGQNITVDAFTGGGGGSMKVDVNGKNIYDGEMTRFTERKSGVVKQSTFKQGEKPKIKR